MVEVILGPTAAGRTNERNGCVHLGDTDCDRVALCVQGSGVRCCYLDVVGNAGIVTLVSVIGRALRGRRRGFIGLALISKMMQTGQVVFDFLVRRQGRLAIGGGCLFILRPRMFVQAVAGASIKQRHSRARAEGWSWQDIAEVLGVSRQAVHKKHGKD